MTTDKIREAFEAEYSCGDEIVDALSLCKNQDGTYQQSLARMCYKWFCKGYQARADESSCPYIISSGEGTNYCSLSAPPAIDKAKLREVLSFVQEITLLNGKYPYVNGTALVRDAYKIAATLNEMVGEK